eukprot:scaffold19114_cov118-Isochrysis_galbana.AAC.4
MAAMVSSSARAMLGRAAATTRPAPKMGRALRRLIAASPRTTGRVVPSGAPGSRAAVSVRRASIESASGLGVLICSSTTAAPNLHLDLPPPLVSASSFSETLALGGSVGSAGEHLDQEHVRPLLIRPIGGQVLHKDGTESEPVVQPTGGNVGAVHLAVQLLESPAGGQRLRLGHQGARHARSTSALRHDEVGDVGLWRQPRPARRGRQEAALDAAEQRVVRRLTERKYQLLPSSPTSALEQLVCPGRDLSRAVVCGWKW